MDKDKKNNLFNRRDPYRREKSLLHKKKLTKDEVEEIKQLGSFYLIEKHIKYIEIIFKIELIDRLLKNRKKHSWAIRLIIADFENVVSQKNNYFNLLLAYCGNQPFREQQIVSRYIADYLYKYFNEIPELKRNHLIHALVMSVNKTTQRAVVHLFEKKFKQINRNNLLLDFLIRTEIIPKKYWQYFYLNKKKMISVNNQNQLKKLLKG